MKVRDVIKLVEEDGWQLERMKGSHRQFKHEEKSGLVTIAGHPSVDVPSGTLNSILKQASLKGNTSEQRADDADPKEQEHE